jgi:DNA-binding protein Fis
MRPQNPHFHLIEKTIPVITLSRILPRTINTMTKSVDGNKTQAAKIIGIDRVSLWRKLQRFEKKGFDIS